MGYLFWLCPCDYCLAGYAGMIVCVTWSSVAMILVLASRRADAAPDLRVHARGNPFALLDPPWTSCGWACSPAGAHGTASTNLRRWGGPRDELDDPGSPLVLDEIDRRVAVARAKLDAGL